MKITIAGANCFIGKRFLALAEKNENIEITAVARKGALHKEILKKNSKIVRILECDMKDYHKLGSLTGEGECFIDLSWSGTRGMDRQNSELQKENYKYNVAAMQSMAENGYKVLVSAGSLAEYGVCASVITEDTLLNPNTEYGKYKVQLFYETEEMSKRYNIRFIEPRYFSLYGPGDYEKTLIMSCIEKMLKDEKCELNDCTQLWDYLYVDDAVEALYRLCVNPKANGAYNFATGEHRMIKDYVMEIHNALRSKSEIVFGSPKSDFKGQIINLAPSVEKLKREIKDAIRISLPFYDAKADRIINKRLVAIIYYVIVIALMLIVHGFKFNLFMLSSWVILLSIINIILCINIATKKSVFNQEGIDHREMLKALERYMLEFSSVKSNGLPEIALWEYYIIFAMAFGISKKVLLQISSCYPNIEDSTFMDTYMACEDLEKCNFNKSFLFATSAE